MLVVLTEIYCNKLNIQYFRFKDFYYTREWWFFCTLATLQSFLSGPYSKIIRTFPHIISSEWPRDCRLSGYFIIYYILLMHNWFFLERNKWIKIFFHMSTPLPIITGWCSGDHGSSSWQWLCSGCVSFEFQMRHHIYRQHFVVFLGPSRQSLKYHLDYVMAATSWPFPVHHLPVRLQFHAIQWATDSVVK